MTEHLKAKAYLEWAVSHLQGAETLQAKLTPGTTLPFYLLIGFAAEDALKAFLIHSGLTEKTITEPKLRHDLARLLACAVEHGFVPSDDERELVDAMSECHRKYLDRYPKPPFTVEVSSPAFAVHAAGLLAENV